MKLTLDDRFAAMPWDEIDTVVFDVGNVLLSFDPEAIMREYVPDRPDLYPAIRRRVFRSPYWVMMDHGTAEIPEIFDAMIGGDKELEEPIRRIQAGWPEMKHPVEEGVRALKACKAHGKQLLVLSNYGDPTFSLVDEKYDFFRLFDGKVISARVKLIKPDHSIYELAAERYGLTPARTLFIDDSPSNIEGAMACGWQGICYLQPGQLDAFFI